mmetsp:Transcript_13537/g.25506  ORF Transcript_13537/g.25506 Transcript_13537/m.25506 type:complete len:194 (+) Transcript_13537:758-1339(+)
MPNRFDVVIAAGLDRSFGKNTRVPFDIPEEFRYYCSILALEGTRNTVICGRNSYDPAIFNCRPVEINEYFVVSRSLESIEGGSVFKTVREALEHGVGHIFVVGGGVLLNSILSSPDVEYLDKIYFTRVDGTFEADTYLQGFTDNIYDDGFFGPHFTETYRSKKYYQGELSYEYTAYSNKAHLDTPNKLLALGK